MNSPELQPRTMLIGAMSVPSPRKQEKQHVLHCRQLVNTQDPFCWADEHQLKLEEQCSTMLEVRVTPGLRWYIKVCVLVGDSAFGCLRFGGLVGEPAASKKGLIFGNSITSEG